MMKPWKLDMIKRTATQLPDGRYHCMSCNRTLKNLLGLIAHFGVMHGISGGRY